MGSWQHQLAIRSSASARPGVALLGGTLLAELYSTGLPCIWACGVSYGGRIVLLADLAPADAVRSLLFTRRTAERLSEVETSLKIYLIQPPAPCVTVGEHQIVLVEDRLEVFLVHLTDTWQTRLPYVFEEGDLMP